MRTCGAPLAAESSTGPAGPPLPLRFAQGYGVADERRPYFPSANGVERVGSENMTAPGQ